MSHATARLGSLRTPSGASSNGGWRSSNADRREAAAQSGEHTKYPRGVVSIGLGGASLQDLRHDVPRPCRLVRRHRRAQVVADAPLVLEELRRQHGADGAGAISNVRSVPVRLAGIKTVGEDTSSA